MVTFPPKFKGLCESSVKETCLQNAWLMCLEIEYSAKISGTLIFVVPYSTEGTQAPAVGCMVRQPVLAFDAGINAAVHEPIAVL
jgi:hypothetical protein